MPRYTYIAIAADGKKAKGTVTAESPYAARKQLRIRNIHPTSINELGTAEEGKSAIASVFTRTGKKQIIDFTRQMATLLNSGIKLTEALTVLTMQAPDTKFKNALTDIRDRVIYDWGLVNWLDCVLATLYAAAYTGLFLLLTWLGFRRKSLNT